MARKVAYTEYVTYVPEAFDQRKGFLAGTDPNPIRIEMRWLTAREIREYEGKLITKVRKDGEVKVPNKRDVERKLVADCVRSVENYDVGGTPITNGAELYDRGENEITAEVIGALLDTATMEGGRLDLLTSRSAG